MGVMRRKLFLLLALFTALCINVRADVTPQQLTDPEYIINNGYSEATAEEVLQVDFDLKVYDNSTFKETDYTPE